MVSKKSKKLATLTAAILVSGLAVAEPAQAATWFDRLTVITGNLPVVKTFIIYIAFLCGLGGIVWGGMDMFKKSKERGGDDVSWFGIGVKFAAGALLVAVTVTTDTFRETIFGSSASSSISGNQY